MIRLIFAPLVLTAISTASFAQEQPAGTGERAAIYEGIPSANEDPPPAISQFVESQAAGQLLASDFIGRTIHDPSGTETGTIEDVLFDESGKLSVVVINVSDLIGTQKHIAINLGDIRRAENGSDLRLIAAIDRTKIEEAPDFTSLSEEMQLNDGQSLTEEEATGGPQPASGNTP